MTPDALTTEPFLSDEDIEFLLAGCEVSVKPSGNSAASSKQKKYDALYMDIADRCSEMSHGVRARVGAVIIKDGNTISMGWNGMPAGMDNTCEDKAFSTKVTDCVTEDEREIFPHVEQVAPGSYQRYRLVTKPEVLHAEQNAICKAARGGTALQGATIYTTLAPCMNCAAMIYNAGITRVVYRTEYSGAGVNFLRGRGLSVAQLVPPIPERASFVNS